MTKKALIKALEGVTNLEGDQQNWHESADYYLLEYINDPMVSKAFGKVPKWYA